MTQYKRKEDTKARACQRLGDQKTIIKKKQEKDDLYMRKKTCFDPGVYMLSKAVVRSNIRRHTREAPFFLFASYILTC